MYWINYNGKTYQGIVYLKHDGYYRAYIAEDGIGDVTLEKWQIRDKVGHHDSWRYHA